MHKLPRENLELLRTLLGFLIDIIDRADVNKMTARNGKAKCTYSAETLVSFKVN